MSVNTAFNSATFKVLVIGFLALLMLIPLAQVNGLVRERSQRADEATAAIASRWGGEQVLGGPVLVIPVRQRVLHGNQVEVIVVNEVILPNRLMIGGPLLPELRRYGIYDTPVYMAILRIEGEFAGADLLAIRCSDCDPLWERAELRLPVSDVRGIREVSALRIGDSDHRFGPDNGGVAGIAAVSTPLPLTAPNESLTLPFSMQVTLAGTRSLSLLPTARQTTANLAATWPDPGFDGAFLPVSRKVTTGASRHSGRCSISIDAFPNIGVKAMTSPRNFWRVVSGSACCNRRRTISRTLVPENTDCYSLA